MAGALLLVGASGASAQFGKNKVVYRDFHWSVIPTEHFDIYFYEGEEESAHAAARMAERAYVRLSRILRHDVVERIPVIVYASHSDFQQTNITPGLIPEGVGGITEFRKRRVFLPFTGSYGEFDHVLTHELVHAFQIDLLFGDPAGDATPFSFQPPLWFMEGMAEYLARGEVDPHTAMWLRWTALEGLLVPLDALERVSDIRVYRIGQAVFAFLGERFGDEKIGELLRKTIFYRSVEKGFRETLGVGLSTLTREWEDAVRREYYPEVTRLDRAETAARRLSGSDREYGIRLAPSISPDGERLVYIRDGRFSKDIMLASALDGQDIRRLVEGERSSDFESLRYFYTSLGWSPDGRTIAFPSKRGGQDVLVLLDVESGKVTRTIAPGLDALHSPSFHPSGKRIVFSGVRNGKSDLYEVNLDTLETTPLTDDPYLARDPQWSPRGDRIAFVTDRGGRTDVEHLVFDFPRIALLDPATGRIELLPGQSGKNICPQWGPEGKTLAFVSDRDGVSDLYIQERGTGRLYRLTRLRTGVTGLIESSPSFSWSPDGQRLVFTCFQGRGWDLFAMEEPLSKMTPLGAVPPPDPEPLFTPLPSQVPPRNEVADQFGPELPSAGDATSEEWSVLTVRDETLHTLPPLDSLRVEPYRLRWSPDIVAASPVFASNVGFAGQARLAFSDILSNHTIQVGVSVYGSIEDSDLLLGYYNLKKRTNWGVTLYQFRNDFGLFAAPDRIEFQSQIYRGAYGFLSRPFSKFSRLELGVEASTISSRVFSQSFQAGGSFETEETDGGVLVYAGPEVAWVTDTVVYGFHGPLHGTRARLSVDHTVGDVRFTTGILDWRRYFSPWESTVFAVRLVGGVSDGETPQVFRIGGPETLRCLDYGERTGRHVALTNLELRFPLVESIRMGWPLRIGLGGIHGALFADVGSAWSRHYRGVTDGALHDLVAGYGFGMRLGLGYFALKYDYAWRTDLQRTVGDPRNHFSIGVEF
ncbi:MAG: DPP IV N-terminal domain-containing protein [Gemmatimonadota bacterium]|nr:hypothetical protein [Gemmatimonadota bacterium]MDP6528129.1 DPP IV N-terminal domain-containing protein [Gemmatimonadota bacterium]